MPKIRRQNLPAALFNHLLDRVMQREISADQLGRFADWLAGEPEVPTGQWFKRFSEMIVCGEGELVETFLRAGQALGGEEVKQPSKVGLREGA
jgi:hypothetical protein